MLYRHLKIYHLLLYFFLLSFLNYCIINVREYRTVNQAWAIQIISYYYWSNILQLNYTTDVSWGAEIAYPPGAHEFNPSCSGICVTQLLVFCVVFSKSLFVYCFLLVIIMYFRFPVTSSNVSWNWITQWTWNVYCNANYT